ncbi:piggyBac transposable element-derived protein 4-like [Palaemon carinicauda]|uniref:piggyBac transposable element-derived protein 4-like n=1 Tax=Palaemon carinicauda TaxID=392227 RepID=UPI0035B61213
MSLPVNLFYGAGGENNLFCGAGRVSDEDPPLSDEDIDAFNDISDASDYEQQIYTSDDDMNNESDSENDEFAHIYKLGKDKVTKWYTECPRSGRKSQHNIVQEIAGLHNAFSSHSELTAFNFSITDRIIEKIFEAINQRGSNIYGEDWKDVNRVELLSWLGFHIRCGINKDSPRHIEELFSTKTGLPIYRATMSRIRFQQIKRCIRFDDMNTRMERKSGEQGRLAPIYEVFQNFVEACQVNYKASEYVTIDESLVPFTGRSRFKVYMPGKPEKYGI